MPIPSPSLNIWGPIPLLQLPTFLSLWFSTPISVLRHVYMCVWVCEREGNMLTGGKPWFVCIQGTMNVSVHTWKHAHVSLCVDHMFLFNPLHICAGNNSGSLRMNDHSLSKLIRHVTNLNDVGPLTPQPCFITSWWNPVTFGLHNSIFYLGKRTDLLTISWGLSNFLTDEMKSG